MDSDAKRRVEEAIKEIKDPYLASTFRAAYHLRRFGVIYLFTLLAVVGLILLPTVTSSAGRLSAGSTGGSPYAVNGGGAATGTAGAAGSSSAASANASGSGVSGSRP